VWYDARIETDFDSRIVRIKTLRVPNVRFPDASEEQQNNLARLLEREVLAWDLDISLDRLLTGLDLAAQRRGVTSDLNNAPPAIIFTTVPSILVTIDGDPSLQTIPNTNYRRIINSPFDIIFDPTTETYYLFAGADQWYSSPRWQDSWTLASSVPADLAQLAPEEPEEEEPAEDAEPEEPEEPGPPPEIVVATEPTELVVSDGEIEFTPMGAVNNLLYVSNSESDIVFDIETQTYYVVLSGRWFQSKSLTDGPWTFVEGADLPQSFNFIPPDGEMGHLLVSVPGTEAAENAVLENQIPQTSAIDRSTTTLEVTYDGDPIFEPIPNTNTAYATNTDVSVIRVDGVYYACDDAVWFVAGNPHGPWSVADEVPDDIYEIPPSVPVYNVTYVHVYHSTPSVVYVGYYPGYVGSYVYGGTIVYGTGY
jgi:hypothetical protein